MPGELRRQRSPPSMHVDDLPFSDQQHIVPVRTSRDRNNGSGVAQANDLQMFERGRHGVSWLQLFEGSCHPVAVDTE